jgi:hypothetical protein
MNENTALVTTAAQAAAEATLEAYSNGVAAHIGGDWGRHNVVRVYQENFTDNVAHIATAYSLRLLLTGATETAVIVPLLPVSASSTPGSVPQIVVQPVGVTLTEGSSLTLTVAAISETALTYQWYLDGVAISGATASTYLNTATTSDDAGTYYVIVTNAYGSATSDAVVVVEEA